MYTPKSKIMAFFVAYNVYRRYDTNLLYLDELGLGPTKLPTLSIQLLFEVVPLLLYLGHLLFDGRHLLLHFCLSRCGPFLWGHLCLTFRLEFL